MAEHKHSTLSGKVHVYKRPDSPISECSTDLQGKSRRVSTKDTSLSAAKDFAENWYLDLMGKKHDGRLGHALINR